MPTSLFTTAFKQQRLGLMFSVILVILVYMGTLAMAAQAVLARTALTWGYDLQSRLTVELPFAQGLDETQRMARSAEAARLLSALPAVQSAAPLPAEKAQDLLRPWIDDPSLLTSLPLPQLIAVDLKVGASLEGEEARRALAPLGLEGVKTYGHAEWMNQLLGFLTGLGVIATLMLVLTAFAVVTVISVICRAALAVQHDTIELLYFMGAPDGSIARQFQTHIRRLAAPAALVGFLLAVLTVAVLVFLLSSLGGLSLIAPLSWVTLAAMTALVPLGAIALSVVTARQSLLKLLHRLG